MTGHVEGQNLKYHSAIGHFSTNIAILAEQNLIARTNLLYISYGEAIIMFLLLINGQPISNPHFKLWRAMCMKQ